MNNTVLKIWDILNDTEREVMKSINALHGAKTVIIVAHRMSTVKNCDFLVELKNGCINRVGKYQELYST